MESPYDQLEHGREYLLLNTEIYRPARKKTESHMPAYRESYSGSGLPIDGVSSDILAFAKPQIDLVVRHIQQRWSSR